MNRAEVVAGVRDCLAAVLEVKADIIGENDEIISKLGMDSLDFLDLTFRLEQRFRVRISPREIERRTLARLEGKPLAVNGVYTPEALAVLRGALPEIPTEEFADGLTVAALPRKFRVATMVNLVCRLLEEKGG